MNYKIENEKIQVIADTHGGELHSLRHKENEKEYLWNGDSAFWGRRSPILFPFVGSLKDKQYQYNGQIYPMSQHGFARDMEFTVIKNDAEELWFELCSNEDTLPKYPFHFKLQLGYRLDKDTINVVWRVTNTGNQIMHFSIGGHPAFMCPIESGSEQKNYYIRFNTDSNPKFGKINSEGLLYSTNNELNTQCGLLQIDEHLFDEDALIFEHPDFTQIELLTPQKVPYLRVTSDMPLLGIWSPAKKNAPFVCIEPWCGRCDSVAFTGTLDEREYGQTLSPNETFEKSYSITLL